MRRLYIWYSLFLLSITCSNSALAQPMWFVYTKDWSADIDVTQCMTRFESVAFAVKDDLHDTNAEVTHKTRSVQLSKIIGFDVYFYCNPDRHVFVYFAHGNADTNTFEDFADLENSINRRFSEYFPE